MIEDCGLWRVDNAQNVPDKMPLVNAAGVNVNFPFEPYPCQITYMEKVVTCFQQGVNGILESPTGTGKTLCLLCASLAWLGDKKAQIASQRWKTVQMTSDGESVGGIAVNVENTYTKELANQLEQAAGAWTGELGAPKIIFASRTHSQLSQAIQELKRTAYSHVKVCIIGSREQLCIHPQILKEPSNTAKVHMCRAKVTARTCHFYNQVENGKGNFMNQVLDIEDLVTLGNKLKVCPYYTARELKKDADIIFMPYNYLLDPKSRKAHGIELQGNIVIFDEAHNLEKICEDSASFDITSGEIASAISEINRVIEKLQDLQKHEEFASVDSESSNMAQDFSLEEVLLIKAQLLQLEQEIDNLPLPSSNERTESGSFIFDLFEKANITFENKNITGNVLEKMVSFLTNDTSGTVFSSRGNGLAKFSDVIKIVFSREPPDFSPMSNHKKAISKHYKVHIKDEQQANKKKLAEGWGKMSTSKSGRVLSYWCFSPGHTMDDLRSHGVKSIILTSGTLSPMASFASEMGIEFKIQLENPHVISPEQVWVATLAKGPDGTTLSSAYDTRFKPAYQASLGNAIVNFSRVVPSGLLLFFPSYPLLESCTDSWQKAGIWKRIEQHKTIFIEPKNKVEFATAMDGFYEKVNDPSTHGAVFAAVCRGKVSEGLDFADANGRAVVITGLPFPPRMDPKVILKMKFLDESRAQSGKGLTGADWYRLQASRAVNQAVGRVIRHRQDYGAIILCDSRFCGTGYLDQLPAWLRPSVTNYVNFGLAMRDMMMFFKKAEQTMPAPKASKKRKMTVEMGCQGAYFMPSASRHSAATELTKAAVVETHISSLRPNNNDDSFHKMLKHYKSSEREPLLASKPIGLLGALDTIEIKKESTECFEQRKPDQMSFKETINLSDSSRSKQRKKIVIKFVIVRLSQQSESVTVSSDVTQDSLQTAEQYCAEVKRTLSSASYARFSAALKGYKSNSDFMTMMQCMVDIFGDDKCKHRLLRKLSRFVRSEHREKFREICLCICGHDTGSRLQSCVPNENKLIAGSIENVRQKAEFPTNPVSYSASSAMKIMAKCEPVSGSSSSLAHLNTVNHLAVGSHLSGLSGAQVASSSKSTAASSIVRSSAPLLATQSTHFPVASTSSQLNGANLQMHFDATPSGFTCCRCALDAKVPFRSPCGHVCCMLCWKAQLSELKQCPSCLSKVRRRNLTRVYFSCSRS